MATDYNEIYHWMIHEMISKRDDAVRISTNPKSMNEEITDSWTKVRTISQLIDDMEKEFNGAKDESTE